MKKLKKPRSKSSKNSYKPVFTSEEYKLLQNYGVGNLLDEIGLNRIMLYRLVHKMNQESPNLSFRDHLDATRVIAYTTGHITRQVAIREQLFQPYQEVENQYKEYGEKVQDLLEKVGITLFGEEEWGSLIMEALRNKPTKTERKSKK